MCRRSAIATFLSCAIIMLASHVFADIQMPPTGQQKAERSSFFPYDLEKARFALGGVGGTGLAFIFPALLLLGLFIVAVPIFSLIFMGGLTGGFGATPGLYPASRKRSGTDPLFNQENLIRMVSFVDKALQDVGKQLNAKHS